MRPARAIERQRPTFDGTSGAYRTDEKVTGDAGDAAGGAGEASAPTSGADEREAVGASSSAVPQPRGSEGTPPGEQDIEGPPMPLRKARKGKAKLLE